MVDRGDRPRPGWLDVLPAFDDTLDEDNTPDHRHSLLRHHREQHHRARVNLASLALAGLSSGMRDLGDVLAGWSGG